MSALNCGVGDCATGSAQMAKRARRIASAAPLAHDVHSASSAPTVSAGSTETREVGGSTRPRPQSYWARAVPVLSATHTVASVDMHSTQRPVPGGSTMPRAGASPGRRGRDVRFRARCRSCGGDIDRWSGARSRRRRHRPRRRCRGVRTRSHRCATGAGRWLRERRPCSRAAVRQRCARRRHGDGGSVDGVVAVRIV